MSTEPDKKPKRCKITKNRRKKPKWPLILVLVTIGILFIAGIIALYVVSRDPRIIKPEENTKFFTDSFLNLVIVVIIIVQSVIYVFQWIAMRDVIGQNERLIRASQRQARTAEKNLHFAEGTLAEIRAQKSLEYAAIVTIAEAYPDNPLKYPGVETPPIIVSFLNVGRTTATHVKVYAEKWLTDIKPNEFQPQPVTKIIDEPGTLAPNQPFKVDVPFPSLSETDIFEIRGETSFFYVWGKIEYNDIFGKPHWTSFCYYLHRNRTKMILGNRLDNISDYMTYYNITGFDVKTTVGKQKEEETKQNPNEEEGQNPN